MTQPIRVWSIHDDPQGHHSQWPEDRTWLAIAAETEEHAKAIAASHYDGDIPRNDWDWRAAFVAIQVDTSNWPDGLKPRFPRRITCLETLRLMGWHEEGESECDCCGLAAMGMRAYEIRECCGCCPKCCDCGNDEDVKEDDDEIPF
jgi:hypothetical protein